MFLGPALRRRYTRRDWFHMSQFIAGEVVPNQDDVAAAKIAIFVASLVAGFVGIGILWRHLPYQDSPTEADNGAKLSLHPLMFHIKDTSSRRRRHLQGIAQERLEFYSTALGAAGVKSGKEGNSGKAFREGSDAHLATFLLSKWSAPQKQNESSSCNRAHQSWLRN